jgi:hypothetical protein
MTDDKPWAMASPFPIAVRKQRPQAAGEVPGEPLTVPPSALLRPGPAGANRCFDQPPLAESTRPARCTATRPPVRAVRLCLSGVVAVTRREWINTRLGGTAYAATIVSWGRNRVE